VQQHDKDYIHLQSEATAKLKDLSKERDVLDALGTQLRANQAALKSSLVAAQEAAAKQDAEITDLKEQVRDLMMYLEAQRVVEASGGESSLSHGTVLPLPEQTTETKGRRRTPRKPR